MSEIERLTRERDSLSDSLRVTGELVISLKREAARLERERAKELAELDEARHDVDVQRAIARDMGADFSRCIDECADLRIQVDRLTRERDTAKTALAFLRTRLAAVEQTNERFRAQVEREVVARVGVETELRKAKLVAEGRYDCHGDPPVCGACISCLLREIEAAGTPVKFGATKAKGTA